MRSVMPALGPPLAPSTRVFHSRLPLSPSSPPTSHSSPIVQLGAPLPKQGVDVRFAQITLVFLVIFAIEQTARSIVQRKDCALWLALLTF